MREKERMFEESENGIILLGKRDLKVLSSDIRVEILKKLDSGCKTLRKLGNELNLPTSTVHENLTILVESGFVEKRNEGSKWVYYELTEKGKSVLHPHEKVKIILLLSSAILSYAGGIMEIYLFLQGTPEEGVKGAPFHPEHLILGFVLAVIGTILLYSGLRKALNDVSIRTH